MPRAAVLDIDGTLVDSNYQHALAWFRAFRRHGITLPIWRVHRAIGKGGDKLVADLAGEEVERDQGDRIREAEKECYGELIGEVVPFEGARDLVVELKRRGQPVVLASSAKPDEADHYLDLVGVRDLADAWTTSEDVEATKPEPDLVRAALERIGEEAGAVMVGDSTWDCIAAARAGLDTLAVLTGGFSEAELREAGAVAVFQSIPELCQRMDQTPLAG